MRLRFSLASRLMLLPVALLPVIADWPHANLHGWSLAARLSDIRRSCGANCAAILAGVLSLVLSLVLLTLPASPVLQMKLSAWRMAMQLRDGKRVVSCESRGASPGQLRWRGGL